MRSWVCGVARFCVAVEVDVGVALVVALFVLFIIVGLLHVRERPLTRPSKAENRTAAFCLGGGEPG